MIKVIAYLVFGLILTTFEATFLKFLPIDFFKPDLGIPFIIYTTFFLGPQAGLVTAVFIGLMQEIVSSSPGGSLLFTKVSIFVISVFMRNTASLSHAAVPCLLNPSCSLPLLFLPGEKVVMSLM
jgi:rod shape-determining protein MreD